MPALLRTMCDRSIHHVIYIYIYIYDSSGFHSFHKKLFYKFTVRIRFSCSAEDMCYSVRGFNSQISFIRKTYEKWLSAVSISSLGSQCIFSFQFSKTVALMSMKMQFGIVRFHSFQNLFTYKAYRAVIWSHDHEVVKFPLRLKSQILICQSAPSFHR